MKKYAVFTMDVETFSDTECVYKAGFCSQEDMLDGMEQYLKLLDWYDIKSTLFTVGELAPRIAYRLRPHLRNGHRLALHNATHVAPMDQDPEEFRTKLKSAKEELQNTFGVPVEGFRAPCFSMDRQRLDILQELGFRYDSSHLDFLAARHTVQLELDEFETPRKGIYRKQGFYEFAMSRHRMFGRPYPISGGGYVRLGLWSFIKQLIRQYLKENDFYVFYLHPFELSRKRLPKCPNLCAADRFYLRRCHGKFHKRVERIIIMLKQQGYQFVTFEQLAAIMEKEYAQKESQAASVQ